MNLINAIKAAITSFLLSLGLLIQPQALPVNPSPTISPTQIVTLTPTKTYSPTPTLTYIHQNTETNVQTITELKDTNIIQDGFIGDDYVVHYMNGTNSINVTTSNQTRNCISTIKDGFVQTVCN